MWTRRRRLASHSFFTICFPRRSPEPFHAHLSVLADPLPDRVARYRRRCRRSGRRDFLRSSGRTTLPVDPDRREQRRVAAPLAQGQPLVFVRQLLGPSPFPPPPSRTIPANAAIGRPEWSPVIPAAAAPSPFPFPALAAWRRRGRPDHHHPTFRYSTDHATALPDVTARAQILSARPATSLKPED